MEYVVLWFDVNDEWVAAMCNERDLKRGVVKLQLRDAARQRYYSIGYRPINCCGKVGKFKYFEELPGRLKWEDRDKLFEKYPCLKELAA